MIIQPTNNRNIGTNQNRISVCKRLALSMICLVAFALGSTIASAHPLGNFTINHFTRI